MTKMLLIILLAMGGCESNTFPVKSVSFSGNLEKILSLYIDEMRDNIDPSSNVLYVNVQKEADQVKLLIHNNMVTKGDFENCSKEYDYVSRYRGYKVYVFASEEYFFTVLDKKVYEQVPQNCQDYIPVTYDGAVWEITIKENGVKSFDARFMNLSKETKSQVMSLNNWNKSK